MRPSWWAVHKRARWRHGVVMRLGREHHKRYHRTGCGCWFDEYTGKRAAS